MRVLRLTRSFWGKMIIFLTLNMILTIWQMMQADINLLEIQNIRFSNMYLKLVSMLNSLWPCVFSIFNMCISYLPSCQYSGGIFISFLYNHTAFHLARKIILFMRSQIYYQLISHTSHHHRAFTCWSASVIMQRDINQNDIKNKLLLLKSASQRLVNVTWCRFRHQNCMMR